MQSSIGVNLRVTAHSNQGGRKYMEDMFCVAYQPTSDERDLLYAYFGIFDGHGGREAASYAKAHLMDFIVSQKNFWSDDDDLVMKAIREGFISTHYAMWKELEKWPKTASGLPSTSGTTASIVFVRRGKMYVGHVGDSGIILGIQEPGTAFWRAKPLTRDHKPESAAENARITQSGGKVISKSGVPRVVWNRPRIGHRGPVRRSTHIDEIPFLAVARSLGDLWSYNSAQNEFVVSPEPDVSVIDIDVSTHRCIILGSDGLWNMLNAQDAVNSVFYAERNNERQLLSSPPEGGQVKTTNWINPSKRLVDRALDRWYNHNLRADNTSVVTVVIDPPGPPKATVLRQNQNRTHVVRQSVSSVTDPTTSKTVPAMVLAPISGPKPPCASTSNISSNSNSGLASSSSFPSRTEGRPPPPSAFMSESFTGRTHRSRSSPPSSSDTVNTTTPSMIPGSSSSSVGSSVAASSSSSAAEKIKSFDAIQPSGSATTTGRTKLKRKFEAIGTNNTTTTTTTTNILPGNDASNSDNVCSIQKNAVCSSITSPPPSTTNPMPPSTNTIKSNKVSRQDASTSNKIETNNSSNNSQSQSLPPKSQTHQDDVQIYEISSSSESSTNLEVPIKRRKMTRSATSETSSELKQQQQKQQQQEKPITRNSRLSSTTKTTTVPRKSLTGMKKITNIKSNIIKRLSRSSMASTTTSTNATPINTRHLKTKRLSAPANLITRRRPTSSSSLSLSLKTPQANSTRNSIQIRPKSVPTVIEKTRSLRSDVKNSKRVTRSMKK